MSCERGLLDVIGTRASVRTFKHDPVPDEVVDKILWAATRAPTAGGRENWLFVVVKSEELRRKIHELLIEAHSIYAREIARMPPERIERWRKLMKGGMYLAPLYIAVYIDLSRLSSRNEAFTAEFVMEIQSAAAAMENAILAAWCFGVGSVWLGVPLLMEESFRELLGVPRGYKIMGILALGYPSETPSPKRRKPPEEVSKVV